MEQILKNTKLNNNDTSKDFYGNMRSNASNKFQKDTHKEKFQFSVKLTQRTSGLSRFHLDILKSSQSQFSLVIPSFLHQGHSYLHFKLPTHLKIFHKILVNWKIRSTLHLVYLPQKYRLCPSQYRNLNSGHHNPSQYNCSYTEHTLSCFVSLNFQKDKE